MRFDARDAECVVFVEREGVLRRIGHDVKLTVRSFWIDMEAERVEASFDASSLEVSAAMVEGREEGSLLSDRDKAEIADHVKTDVLNARKHSAITFVSQSITQDSEDTCTIAGTLMLCGAKRAVTLNAKRTGKTWVAECALHQPDFGIRPFSAMLGALKVKPTVRVRVSVPS